MEKKALQIYYRLLDSMKYEFSNIELKYSIIEIKLLNSMYFISNIFLIMKREIFEEIVNYLRDA
jgi:hypothetical protein